MSPATDVGNDSTGGKEVQEQKITMISEGKVSAEQSGFSRQHPILTEMVNEMEDQLIMAMIYLQFAPPNNNSHLVRALKLRIKEIQRVLGHSRGSSVPRGVMEDALSKANKAYPDCSALASKLHAMTHNSEEQLRQQVNQASFLIELAASTFPKGLHCLSMRLTTDYFTLKPEDRQLPNRDKVRNENLYHYAIFSDNILACAVAVNSTISSSQVVAETSGYRPAMVTGVAYFTCCCSAAVQCCTIYFSIVPFFQSCTSIYIRDCIFF